MNLSRADHKHVVGLDVLRFAAATLVVAYHFGFWNWLPERSLAVLLPDQAPAWGAQLHFGWIGVEIFFVISGFVIANSMSGTGPGTFLRGRFLRLAPASWIAATLALLIKSYVGPSALPALLPVYVKTMVFWPFGAIDDVWWTLGIEIDFYLLAYLLLRKGRGASLEAVIVPIGILSGLFWIVSFGLQAALDGADGVLGLLRDLVTRAQHNRELQLLLVQHGCLFALGVVFSSASRFGITRGRALAMAALVCACILEIVGQNRIIERASGMVLPVSPAILWWCAAMGFLAASVAFNGPLTRWAGRGGRFVRFVGLATYPLYLVHNVIGLGVSKALAPLLGSAAVGAGVFAGFAAAAVIAATAEPWLRRRLSRMLPGAQQPAATVRRGREIAGRAATQ